MKTILTSILTLFVAFAFAQNSDKTLAKVRYSFTHVLDTTQKQNPHTENMLLLIGKNASVYTSYDRINRSIEMAKQLEEQIKNQAGSGSMSIKVDQSSSKKVTDIDYYYFAKENKVYTRERIFNNYLVEETAPKINWNISTDTASFSGIHCQKATTYFKGRNWNAWFAADLPFTNGPWKLNGLPGLIVEAYDDTKEVQFKFAGFENVSSEEVKTSNEKEMTGNIFAGQGATVRIMGMDTKSDFSLTEIKLPANAVKATKKELDKLKEAREKDPQGFINSQLAANGISINMQNTTFKPASSAPSSKPKIAVNNPIELPEKK